MRSGSYAFSSTCKQTCCGRRSCQTALDNCSSSPRNRPARPISRSGSNRLGSRLSTRPMPHGPSHATARISCDARAALRGHATEPQLAGTLRQFTAQYGLSPRHVPRAAPWMLVPLRVGQLLVPPNAARLSPPNGAAHRAAARPRARRHSRRRSCRCATRFASSNRSSSNSAARSTSRRQYATSLLCRSLARGRQVGRPRLRAHIWLVVWTLYNEAMLAAHESGYIASWFRIEDLHDPCELRTHGRVPRREQCCQP